MKIDRKRKLTSRKLWMAVAGLATGLVFAFNGSAETAETIAGVIMSAASVVAYIMGEGLTDATHGTDPMIYKTEAEATTIASANDAPPSVPAPEGTNVKKTNDTGGSTDHK